MRKFFVYCMLLIGYFQSFAQKRLLDHSVYDSWQSIGERMISNDGKWVVYTINVQEGDNDLVIQSSDATYKKTISRGYTATITEDNRFVVFKIKPFYKETRDAKIKKKKPDEMPKDSFAIVELGKYLVYKVPKVKTFKTPEKGFGWVAYNLEKTPEPEKFKSSPGDNGNKKIVDSLNRTIDSLMILVSQPPPSTEKKKKKRDEEMDNGELLSDNYEDAESDDAISSSTTEGTDLVLRNLLNGVEKTFPFVSEYYFNKTGKKLVIETTKNVKDSLSKAAVLMVDLERMKTDTILNGGNDFKNFAMTDDGSQLAFVAERDSKPKDLQKFYKLWYYKEARPDDPVGRGMDSAIVMADKNSVGMKLGMTISEFGNINFSKSGKRVFFGTAPIQPPKDTALVDFETAKLDIWHYNEDYLQTVQLFRLKQNLEENYLAMYDIEKNVINQLGSKEIPTVYQTKEGDGETFAGVSDFGKRIESQWQGYALKDIYAINVADGSKKLVGKDINAVISPAYISPTG